MNISQTEAPTSRKPLRVWPGVVIASLPPPSMFALPAAEPVAVIRGMLGGAACALAILVWRVFFSRASWAERLGAVAPMIVAIFATRLVLLSEQDVLPVRNAEEMAAFRLSRQDR